MLNEDYLTACRYCIPGQLSSPVRLRLLRESGLTEGTHPQLDRLTALAKDLLNVPVVLVSLVDVDRQIFSSQVGLGEPWKSRGETPLSHSFCQHVVTTGKPLIIDNARLDKRVEGNRAIEELGVIAYAGFPIISQTQVLGSFCAIRTAPHTWTELELRILQQLSDAVSDQVELRLDITLLKRAQENLEESNSQLEQFAHILSHDLKSPLRGVSGSLQVLEQILDPLEGEAAEFLSHALSSADKMAKLIDALRDYSAAFESPGERAWVDLDQIVDSVERDLREILKPIGGVLIRDNALGKVWGTPPFLSQIFQNLITNSLKFRSPERNLVINIGRRANDHIYVQDNGIGIEAKYTAKIFQVYGRVHRPDKYEGSGMGLAICARAVAQHNGQIWVESEPGQGATFVMTLPDAPNSLQVSSRSE